MSASDQTYRILSISNNLGGEQRFLVPTSLLPNLLTNFGGVVSTEEGSFEMGPEYWRPEVTCLGIYLKP
jgi:hypothetical protein